MPAKHELDFLIIGAQKSGTTSLFEHLRSHPELYLPEDKEAPYFSHDRLWNKGWDEYLTAHFDEASEDCRWGTATPHYMAGSVYESASQPSGSALHYDELTVPLRIRERLPDVKLVAVLRNPALRAFSHYRMSAMRGIESRTFDHAVAELLPLEALEAARTQPTETNAYVVWGEYGRILRGFYETFAAERILIVFMEDLERDPRELLRRVFSFIGVASEFIPNNLDERHREGGSARRAAWLDPDAFQASVAGNLMARALWNALPRAGRRWADRRFESLIYQAELWNRRKPDTAVAPSPEAIAALDEHFRSDGELLASLLDLAPPWTSSEASTR